MSSKREQFMQTQQNTLDSLISQTNSVDDTINEMNKKVEIPEEAKANSAFTINIKAKEHKTARKSFILSESVNNAFTKTAKEKGVSENELLNVILKQVFQLE